MTNYFTYMKITISRWDAFLMWICNGFGSRRIDRIQSGLTEPNWTEHATCIASFVNKLFSLVPDHLVQPILQETVRCSANYISAKTTPRSRYNTKISLWGYRQPAFGDLGTGKRHIRSSCHCRPWSSENRWHDVIPKQGDFSVDVY